MTGSGTEEIVSEFWQQWQEMRDQLCHCCLKYMNFNPTDAEDALSQAMFKAWEKVQKYAGKISRAIPIFMSRRINTQFLFLGYRAQSQFCRSKLRNGGIYSLP